MDIGKTIRCYTVEPLRDPVPAPQEYSVRVPDSDRGYDRVEFESEPLAPSVLRRISG